MTSEVFFLFMVGFLVLLLAVAFVGMYFEKRLRDIKTDLYIDHNREIQRTLQQHRQETTELLDRSIDRMARNRLADVAQARKGKVLPRYRSIDD